MPRLAESQDRQQVTLLPELRRADQELPRRGHLGPGAQARHFQRPLRRALRQGRLHIHRPRRRVPVPCRRARHSAVRGPEQGTGPAHLPVQRLPALPDEAAVHAWSLQTHPPMGTRCGARSSATPVRQAARRHDASPPDDRARLRHTEARNGFDTLPRAQTDQPQHRIFEPFSHKLGRECKSATCR